MYYEINIALDGRHFFATAPRSLTSHQTMLKVLKVLDSKFPVSEGYSISLTRDDQSQSIIPIEKALQEIRKTDTLPRTIKDIAFEIHKDWSPIHITARNYHDAMFSLETINDKYGADSGKSIVAYFLANAGTWKGEVARRIKKELNELIK